jgi:hypothetical protein
MLQTHGPNVPNACIPWLAARVGCLAHTCSTQPRTRTSRVAGTFQLALDWSYAGCRQQEGCGGWCSEFEGEGAVGSDCHAGWNGCARDIGCCSRVEFLICMLGKFSGIMIDGVLCRSPLTSRLCFPGQAPLAAMVMPGQRPLSALLSGHFVKLSSPLGSFLVGDLTRNHMKREIRKIFQASVRAVK